MRKFTLLLNLCLLFCIAATAQTVSQYFENGNALASVSLLKENAISTACHRLQPLDVEALLEEDAAENGLLRVGKNMNVSYAFTDGTWTDVAGGRVWSIAIDTQDAVFLNLMLSDLSLPDGAYIYLSNQEGTFLNGPVTSSATNGSDSYITDMIPGSNAVVYLFEPTEKRGQASMAISNVVYGYKGSSILSLSDPASSCNVNAACHPEYATEADAVCLMQIFYGEKSFANTGSLIRAADNSFKYYCLTGFHCIDVNTTVPLKWTNHSLKSLK